MNEVCRIKGLGLLYDTHSIIPYQIYKERLQGKLTQVEPTYNKHYFDNNIGIQRTFAVITLHICEGSVVGNHYGSVESTEKN